MTLFCADLRYYPLPRAIVVHPNDVAPDCNSGFLLDTELFLPDTPPVVDGGTTIIGSESEFVVLNASEIEAILSTLLTEFNEEFFQLIIGASFTAMAIGITGGWIYRAISRSIRW